VRSVGCLVLAAAFVLSHLLVSTAHNSKEEETQDPRRNWYTLIAAEPSFCWGDVAIHTSSNLSASAVAILGEKRLIGICDHTQSND
jgi:hypothetical protein